MQLTFPVVTVAALVDSINPCAISVLLLTLGFLVSLNSSKRKILSVAGLYIFGIFITYILIGLGVLSVLSFFGIPKVISKFGALLLILTGLINLAEVYIPNFPVKLAIPKFIKPQIAELMYKSTYFSALLMGIVVGLFEFPCTGGPYLMILSLLHDTSTVNIGALYLIYYNLIFVSPLVLVLLMGASPAVTDRVQQWRKRNSKTAAVYTALATLVLGGIILYI